MSPWLLQLRHLQHHARFASNEFSTAKASEKITPKQFMQLIFLGTSAALPTISRNTTCIALKYGKTTYMFDCGEGSYRQFQRSPLHLCTIEKIFITHMHGDHVLGIPGFLCSIGRTLVKYKRPIEIFGPQGLRDWLRTSLKACSARVAPRYMVHELLLKEEKSLAKVAIQSSGKSLHEDELPGEDISCSGDGVWHVCHENNLQVKAGILQHNVPCWGYVLEEQIGRSNLENLIDPNAVSQENFKTSTLGKKMGKLSLSLGIKKRNRKVVILGDTRDSRSLLVAAKDADLLVHEATIVREHDVPESILHTHSSPYMAGEFAKSINSKSLVLTHFSGYTLGRDAILVDLVNQAKEAFGNDKVVAAKDYLVLPIT